MQYTGQERERDVVYRLDLRRVFHRPEPCPVAAPAAARHLPGPAALSVVFAPDLYRCRWPGQEEEEELHRRRGGGE